MKKCKLIHTSDWHLGKKLFGKSRLPEQKQFLEWLIKTALEQEVHYFVIAGDIFDTPKPSDEALKLYFSFLNDCSLNKIEVFIISGNHDSGHFLEAPKEFLNFQNIFVNGKLSNSPKDHYFERESFCLVNLPFFRPY